ncbi:ankyrin repeat-containing domain protein [Aspergillus pseudoustus]|uniref:Ankyrin repeat-containing domain protein n=1 Tax=Aspergillus pseudoustus TaxID=1810923 RepID=A0ABR4KRR5_9EURO
MDEHTTERPLLRQNSNSNTDTDLPTRLRTTIDSLLNIWIQGGPSQHKEPQLRKELEALLHNPKTTIEFIDPQVEALILLSAQETDDALFNILIAHDPYAGPNSGFPAPSNEILFWAATHGHASLVERLLNVDGIDPNVMDDEEGGEGETPLSCAASNDQVDVLRILLNDERVDIDRCPEWGKGKDGKGDGHTALWWAVWSGKERAARLLCERGAAVPRIEGENIVHKLLLEAVEKESVSIMEIILASCREAYATGRGPRGFFRWQFFSNHNGQTLLSLAAETGNVSVLELLEQHSDNFAGGLNLLDLNGRTAIWHAASKGHDKALSLLLPVVNHPRAIDAIDLQGTTPLAVAVEQWTARREYPATQRSKALTRRAEVIQQLLAHPMVKTEYLGDEQLWLLLGRSVRSGHAGIVEGLARKDDRVNHESMYFDGCNEKRLVSWAEENHYGVLVDLLLVKRKCADEASSESDTTLC